MSPTPRYANLTHPAALRSWRHEMRPVPRGITVTNRFDPTSRDTAAAVGTAGVEAVAALSLNRSRADACALPVIPK